MVEVQPQPYLFFWATSWVAQIHSFLGNFVDCRFCRFERCQAVLYKYNPTENAQNSRIISILKPKSLSQIYPIWYPICIRINDKKR